MLARLYMNMRWNRLESKKDRNLNLPKGHDSFSSVKACRGVALAKTGRQMEMSKNVCVRLRLINILLIPRATASCLGEAAKRRWKLKRRRVNPACPVQCLPSWI